MTTYFVDNAGSNTAPYDTEAKAATTLATVAAVPWVSGDVVKIASTHTETADAAISYTFPTTIGLRIYSVTFNGSGTGGLAAGATINKGTGSQALNFVGGFAEIVGVTFVGGTANNSVCKIGLVSGSLPTGIVFDGCTLSNPSVHTAAQLTICTTASSANDDVLVRLVDCTLSNGAVKGIAVNGGRTQIENLTLAGTAPTTLFTFGSSLSCASTVLITASDLDNLAWTNFANATAATQAVLVASQCTMRSGFAVTTGTFNGPGGLDVILQDCDSGDNHYTYLRSNYAGTIVASNAIYADASDGTNSVSWLMASSANASFYFPLVSPSIAQWNSGTSAVTSTVEVTNDGTTFKDNELWQETLAKVTTTFPLGTWNRGDRAADVLAAGANQATSTKSWTGTGGFTSEVKQKLVSTSFTPAEVGPIATVVKLAKASASVYVSPKVAVA